MFNNKHLVIYIMNNSIKYKEDDIIFIRHNCAIFVKVLFLDSLLFTSSLMFCYDDFGFGFLFLYFEGLHSIDHLGQSLLSSCI